MADPKNFLLNSDYPMEKIVFTKKGTVNIATLPNKFSDPYWTVKKLEIPHGMGQPLFISFRFKIDNDTDWRTGSATEDCLGYSDSNYLVIMINNITTGILHYEVFGTWIDDYTAGQTPLINTVETASRFTLNTDLTYRKIVLSGTMAVADPSGVYDIAINHHLGYSPIYQVYFDGLPNEVWQEHSGGMQDYWDIANIGGSPVDASDCFSRATPTGLLIGGHTRNFGEDSARVWYRVFADE